jgi:hypothetical protein
VKIVLQRFISTLLFVAVFATFPAESSLASASPSTNYDRGYSYIHEEVASIPLSIHIFKLERGRKDFELATTLGTGKTLGMATVSEQIKAIPHREGQPIAAINGDFYYNREPYPGDPRDLQIRNGELISAPKGHACFWVDERGSPHMTNIESRFKIEWPNGKITPFGLNEERDADQVVLYTSAIGSSTRTFSGREFILRYPTNSAPLRVGKKQLMQIQEVRNRGDSPLSPESMVLSVGSGLVSTIPELRAGAIIQVITETIPDLVGVPMAIGGGPTLVRNGRAMQWSGFEMRHPRVAIGWNNEFIFLVEVDGRQRGLSIGMTFSELSGYMLKLGCSEAMNMDGGGSATLWVCGNVINNPSEGRERPGANALVVLHKTSK